VDDQLADENQGTADDSVWLPKANLVAAPFSAGGPFESSAAGLRELELFVNYGRGFHSNDARAVRSDPGAVTLPVADGVEVGARTRLFGRAELALNWFYLDLEDELVFVGDAGTTESAGRTIRKGVEFATSTWLLDWLYLRGDVSYTDTRLHETDEPLAQAPRFVAKGAIGVRWRGLAAELGVRSFGERYALDGDSSLRLSGYDVLDFGVRYRWRWLELGLLLENLTDTDWKSSEFYYESCAPREVGVAAECPLLVDDRSGIGDNHFTPGNPRNVRGWVSLRF
jgi:hypothetical protein